MISPLVSVSWLSENFKPNATSSQPIVVVDCRFSLADPQRGRSLYEQGHIPGAVYLDLNQDLASAPSPERGRHPLPDLETLSQKLAALGVTFQETLVVAYDNDRFAYAARLWWLLRYLGHDRVAVLDGGLKAWQEQGYPLTSQDPPPVATGSFTPQPRPEMICDRAELKATPHLTLIDSREAPRYRGEIEPIDPVAGHIPGAINAFWKAVTTEQGYAQSPSFHQTYWAEKLLANSANSDQQTIVVYCGSGVTACVNLLSLTIAGFPEAKLYPGSWSEWCHCETAIAMGES
jgi:thiosulfate/3-mercaptopyruvate sulfurtransferase